MQVECIFGPKDGELVEIPDSCGMGFVHGIMMAHSPEYHPFSKEESLFDIMLPEREPAFVALYQLEENNRLKFLRYR